MTTICDAAQLLEHYRGFGTDQLWEELNRLKNELLPLRGQVRNSTGYTTELERYGNTFINYGVAIAVLHEREVVTHRTAQAFLSEYPSAVQLRAA